MAVALISFTVSQAKQQDRSVLGYSRAEVVGSRNFPAAGQQQDTSVL